MKTGKVCEMNVLGVKWDKKSVRSDHLALRTRWQEKIASQHHARVLAIEKTVSSAILCIQVYEYAHLWA